MSRTGWPVSHPNMAHVTDWPASVAPQYGTCHGLAGQCRTSIRHMSRTGRPVSHLNMAHVTDWPASVAPQYGTCHGLAGQCRTSIWHMSRTGRPLTLRSLSEGYMQVVVNYLPDLYTATYAMITITSLRIKLTV